MKNVFVCLFVFALVCSMVGSASADYYDNDPIAIGSATPMTVMAPGVVSFSHEGSYETGSGPHLIIDYQWLLNVPDIGNINWYSVQWNSIPNGDYSSDGLSYHTTNRLAHPAYTYDFPGTYNAVLRVLDNFEPSKTSTFVITGIEVTSPAPVPEPSAILFLVPGLVGLAAVRRRLKK